METYIIGKVISINTDSETIVLENSYKGYYIRLASVEGIEINKFRKIFIYHHTDIKGRISLYGFVSFEELLIFIKFISVKNIGPKTVIKLLKNAGPDVINKVIKNKNFQELSKYGIRDNLIEPIYEKFNYYDEAKLYSKTKDTKDQIVSKLTKIGYKKEDIENELKNFNLITEKKSNVVKEIIINLSNESSRPK
ncbi:MAG: hypothetical protein HRS57_00600 [Mycoplasmataceae bacterium]|nr:hypothetical protein [Mycoplasmataceae bacterium]